ncbi:MAG: recombination-associated protein RdgC [Desulfobacterales bacterium]|nr:recombination-associated protein RdgC [Desulfobacterales bacterium]
MGFLSGSASYVRYAVEGDLPEKFFEFVAERVAGFSFRDIDDTLDEYSIGWVSVGNMFDSRFAFGSYTVADYIVLAMRIDERKVPAAILNKFAKKEEERVKKERELPKLSRAHRQEIKERVRQQLASRAVPAPSVYELCWNLADNTVLFFSNNKKAQAVLEDFFKDCFEVHLVMQVPYLAAGHLLGPDGEEALAQLRPTIFV